MITGTVPADLSILDKLGIDIPNILQTVAQFDE